MKLLTTEEYKATLVPHMINVTEQADEVVDLWGYADPIIESEYHNCSAWDWKVHHIYETPDRVFQHIGIAVPVDNTYLVVIASKSKKSIIGHYMLFLGQNKTVEVSDGA